MNIKINDENNETQQQIVSFADQNQQWRYEIDNRLDSAHTALDSDDSSLANFFSRPIKIDSINWTVGAVFGKTINPWTLYFNNLRVINRISNFNVLRCKLCVRVMINGNGFHYGRGLVSYRPLHNDDSMIKWRYGLVPQDAIGASQRMHVWLDPTKSQGGTLVLPFVWYKNGLSIPETEWTKMGELDLASITTLEHANGGTDSVTISVFAWAEDVSLTMPTVAEPGSLAPQAGEYEEAAQGIISHTSYAIARAAKALSFVPQIAPLATATSMAAKGIGDIAKFFGMSRPVDAGPISSYKPSYCGNLANTNVMDTSIKLTYDVRQELTIDPVATGLGPADEMSITSIVTRESYLTQFPWSTAAVPETLLWNCHVTPMLYDYASPGVGTEIHHTPVSYVFLPFENWRGNLKFRFQVVASSFHKGRLKIVYDPYFNATTEYNVQYTHIIDLAKERDFTAEIAWGQEYTYLEYPASVTPTPPFSTSLLSSASHGESNGIIAVYVVNDLTTPSVVLSDVSILVSVCAGDNFEVANPSSVAGISFFSPQGGEWEYQGAENIIPILESVRRRRCEVEYVGSTPVRIIERSSLRDKILSFFKETICKTDHKYHDCKCIQEDFDEFNYQAGELDNADNDLTQEESKPVSDAVEVEHGVTVEETDATTMVYFADPVSSVRQVLKRYNYYRTWVGIAAFGAGGQRQKMVVPNFPNYQGYDPNGLDNAATPVNPTPYTFGATTLMHYFTPLYLCRRGGIRHKYVWTGTTDRSGIMAVHRLAENGSLPYSQSTAPTVNVTSASTRIATALNNGVLESNMGSAITPVDKNPSLEVELPFMTNYRFFPARKKRLIEQGSHFSACHSVVFPLDDTDGITQIQNWIAAGEDYSLSFFQGCPVMWFEPPPSPSTTA